jgi:hypothetical protein
MRKRILVLIFLFFYTSGMIIKAGGISVDAGLTPAQDRFILRTQYRFMSMNNTMMTAKTHMIPMVVAYGVTSGFSLMARGMYVHRTFSNNTETHNGFNDLYVLSKFRLYRKNTASYVLGIAPHIASNIPIGDTEISMRTWNPEIGLNVSYRPRFFAIDISTSYTFIDLLGKSEMNSGNIYEMNVAFSSIHPFKRGGNNAISPVIEINYSNESAKRDEDNSSNEILFISPGVSFIHSSLVLEALIQIPVYQRVAENGMNKKSKLIFGVKYMF